MEFKKVEGSTPWEERAVTGFECDPTSGGSANICFTTWIRPLWEISFWCY